MPNRKTLYNLRAMEIDKFDYALPERLIAQHPLTKRSASKMLCVTRGQKKLQDRHIFEFPDLIKPGDLLVFNNSKVLPARLMAKKTSGGAVEIMLERMESESSAWVQIRASKSPKPGSQLWVGDGSMIRVCHRQGHLYQVEAKQLKNIFLCFGQVPLPPYINRPPNAQDQTRYQTIYASQEGAVAAPTAGLHFDDALFQALKSRDVQMAYVTLHVGLGTFQPIRTQDVLQHKMHRELVQIDRQALTAIKAAKQKGRRIVAIGTTTVRCLESISETSNDTNPFETNLFIYPGYRFKWIDALLTNFHMPKSSLLVMVSAFAGYETTMHAYRHAIDHNYRFLSYGDAMFIESFE